MREAIESVFAQTVDDWEIVFWDNASIDNTAVIAREYEPKLRYFRSDATVPLYEARNLAFAECRGEYVAFLDADDLWLPRKLQLQLELFEADPTLGLVYCDSIMFGGSAEWRNFDRNPPHRGMVFGALLGRYFLDIETVVVPKRILDQMDHVFDPRFQLVGDQDLFLRITHDHPVDFVSEALSKWRIHEGNWSSTRKELFPIEQRQMVEKLSGMWPDLATRFGRELRRFENKITRRAAMLHWEGGDGRRAREVLGRSALADPLLGGLFIASFLPYDLVHAVRRGLAGPNSPT